MKLFLALAMCFSIMSCSTVQPVVCDVEQSAASAIAASVATALTCSNVAQIQSDLLGALGKANLCSVASAAEKVKTHLKKGKLKGPIGDVVCPLAVSAALGLVTGKVPSSWGCNPATSTSALSSVITQACESAIKI